ncbi:hypothetical protein [Citrobacter sp. FDAARGOS_156]|nr:hypothetical protein [Citrobacter sp. FDAARGOS_156]
MPNNNENDGLEYIPDYEEKIERHFEQTNAEDADIDKRIKKSEK